LFKKLGILPLNDLIKYSALKIMHKFKHNHLPFSFNEAWITNGARNPDTLRNADDFHVPAHNLANIKRLPFFNFPKIWNEDNNINKLNPSSKIYLKSVKSALLNSLAA
jgi:hypothetical protein